MGTSRSVKVLALVGGLLQGVAATLVFLGALGAGGRGIEMVAVFAGLIAILDAAVVGWALAQRLETDQARS